jgi:hypothetical protein
MQNFKRAHGLGAVFLLGYASLAYLPAHADTQALSDGKLFGLSLGVNSSYDAASNTLVGGIQASIPGVATADQLFDQLKSANLRQLNPSYTDNSASVIRLGYRGLPMVTQTAANSPVIRFSVPAINVNVTFNAHPTRDQNQDDLEAYLKSEGGAILNAIQQVLAKVSPIDPIAGNPNSLQSQMVAADYDRNFTAFASNISTPSTGGQEPVSNLIGVGLGFASTTQAGVRSTAVTLPLSYTFRADIDPGRQVTLYAPIAVVDSAGAKTIAGHFGASYRYPMSKNWALTPAIGYGVTGSADLGSAAALFTASVTSQYTYRGDGYDVAFGNSVGLYQTSKISIKNYSFDPKIKNTVFRNGVLVSMPMTFMGTKMAYEISFINTIFTGTDIYSKQYNELGFTIGTNRNVNNARTYLRAGISLLQGQNGIRGFKANVGYWF